MQVVCQAPTTRIDCPVMLINYMGPLLDKERVAGKAEINPQDQDLKVAIAAGDRTAIHSSYRKSPCKQLEMSVKSSQVKSKPL